MIPLLQKEAGAHQNLYSCFSGSTLQTRRKQHWKSCIGFGEHQLPFVFFSWISIWVSEGNDLTSTGTILLTMHSHLIQLDTVYSSYTYFAETGILNRCKSADGSRMLRWLFFSTLLKLTNILLLFCSLLDRPLLDQSLKMRISHTLKECSFILLNFYWIGHFRVWKQLGFKWK